MSTRVVLAVPLLVLALAGCVPTGDPGTGATSTPSASGTPKPSATATTAPTTPAETAAPTPEPTTAPVAQTEPVGLGCGDLISAQQIYDYNANVSLLDSFTPDAGTYAAEAVADQGVACRLINQSSGETIDIGVVKFTKAGYTSTYKATSSSATSVTQFKGYFDTADGLGVAQAFSDPYWVTITSTTFFSAGDAGPLVSAVVGNLG